MKSEFLYSKVMITRNKKQYCGNQLVREGKVLEKPKLDMKGLSIRKVSVNKTTRGYFTDLLQDEILGNENLTHGDVYYSFMDYERRLKAGLAQYDMSFLQPAKYGVFDNYAFPWRVPVVRGVYLWNLLNPENPILEFEKTRLIKLSITKFEDLDERCPDDIKERIKKYIFDKEELAHYGVKILALPLELEKTPEWLNPFIDVNTIVADNLNAAMPIFQSLEFLVTEIKAKKFMTNILPM